METIKLNIVVDKDWLEATWTKEVTTINEVKKDGELVQEDSVATEQVHCESFSGHREHIQMLRAKALELGTNLDEYDYLIKECEDSFIYPTDEEIAKEEVINKIAEAKVYLTSTDFYMTVDKYTELDEARKVELTTKRAEARELINTLEAELGVL